jgi:hypothetical protein
MPRDHPASVAAEVQGEAQHFARGADVQPSDAVSRTFLRVLRGWQGERRSGPVLTLAAPSIPGQVILPIPLHPR